MVTLGGMPASRAALSARGVMPRGRGERGRKGDSRCVTLRGRLEFLRSIGRGPHLRPRSHSNGIVTIVTNGIVTNGIVTDVTIVAVSRQPLPHSDDLPTVIRQRALPVLAPRCS